MDRDGVINKNRPDYVKSWGEFEWIPGVLAALKDITEAGYLIVIVTNQSAIGRGFMTEKELEAIHKNMTCAIELAGGKIFKIYHCPHLPEDNCSCRKPKPDMLFRVKKELKNIEWQNSWMVGDTYGDIQIGKEAGVRTILVKTGKRGKSQLTYRRSWPIKPDIICENLLDASYIIRKVK